MNFSDENKNNILNDPGILKPDESIFSLALRSQFRLLSFEGPADGSDMVQQFDAGELVGKVMTIKSVRLIPYAPAAGGITDTSLVQGAGVPNVETLGANIRLERITDQFNAGTSIRFLINETPISIFSQTFSNATGQYIPDLWEDNIFYKFPAKVQNLRLGVFSNVADNLVTPAASVVLNMRVLLGCYLT